MAGIVLLLLSLESTRGELRDTHGEVTDVTARVQRLDRELNPLLSTVATLTGAVRRPQLRAGVRSAATAVGTLPGLAQDTTDGLQALSLITDAIGRSDLATVLPQVAASLRRAQDPDSELARALEGGTRLLAGLRTTRIPSQAVCDQRLLHRPGIDLLDCVLRTLPNARKLLSDQRRLTARSIRIQTSTENLVRQGVGLLTESLGIQREILGHARSLDTKVPEATAVVP